MMSSYVVSFIFAQGMYKQLHSSLINNPLHYGYIKQSKTTVIQPWTDEQNFFWDPALKQNNNTPHFGRCPRKTKLMTGLFLKWYQFNIIILVSNFIWDKKSTSEFFRIIFLSHKPLFPSIFNLKMRSYPKWTVWDGPY